MERRESWGGYIHINTHFTPALLQKFQLFTHALLHEMGRITLSLLHV